MLHTLRDPGGPIQDLSSLPDSVCEVVGEDAEATNGGRMRRVGQTRKRDVNEPAIIEALEGIGITIVQLSAPGCPDLLCWSPWDGMRLLEVKSKTGTLTPEQKKATVPFTIVRSEQDALALYGVKES